MAEGADCDGTSIELPFFWLCDDNLVQFSKLEHVQGQNTKQRKTVSAFVYQHLFIDLGNDRLMRCLKKRSCMHRAAKISTTTGWLVLFGTLSQVAASSSDNCTQIPRHSCV